MTCYQLLQKKADKNGHIVFYNHKTKIRDILRDVDSFACGLAALGLVKGDVVTIWLPTCPQSLVAFYACSKLGLVANLVHPVTPVDQLAENLKKVNSKALLFYDVLVKDETVLSKLDNLLVRCSIADYVVFRKPIYALYSATQSKRWVGTLKYKQLMISGKSPTENDGSAMVCYMHSGGTSGESKIVKLSNNAFNGTAKSIQKMYHPKQTKGCYSLVTLPIFHAYGLCAGVHTPLLLGYSVALVPKFDVKAVAGYIDRLNVTLWAVVPAMLNKMLKANKLDRKSLKKLDVIWCGGDFLDEQLVEQVDAILQKRNSHGKLMRGYGLTETCGVCAVNSYDYYKKGSCGRPMPNCKIDIIDEKGNLLPPNVKGEIVVYSPGVMKAYLEVGNPFTDDGGVKTGDIGYLDEKGYLYVVDRKKRSVKIAAVNVFPAEVERCIKQLRFVSGVCVVPYNAQGKTFLKAYLMLKDDAPSNAMQLIIDHCKAKLLRYSVPTTAEVLSELPLTKMGKVDFKLLESCANGEGKTQQEQPHPNDE